MAGVLYIVATPIGNLEDITLRALRILKEVDLIAAEDTRVTRKLLNRYEIYTPMISYHVRSKLTQTEKIVAALEEGKNVALVSDAGTPGISDPGEELVKLVIDAGFKVEAIPGPSAIITALVLSGLPTSRFAFDGWPSREAGERRKFFRSIKFDRRTTCLYVAPTRLIETLESVSDELGDRQVAVVREATKMFEEVFRGTAAEAIEHFGKGEVKGEIVLVIAGCPPDQVKEVEQPKVDLDARLVELIRSGLSDRDAVRRCAQELGLPRREVYAAALRLRREIGSEGRYSQKQRSD
ncbi:MAG: 16S rRNA (cytidine(1402)-2'-O)-methyltransferase [Armatimonadetes bacterium]|nr:16S rRNA (cytidine(1402)-2'-O)-methyltransferase [Armatimonadota bacterium]